MHITKARSEGLSGILLLRWVFLSRLGPRITLTDGSSQKVSGDVLAQQK